MKTIVKTIIDILVGIVLSACFYGVFLVILSSKVGIVITVFGLAVWATMLYGVYLKYSKPFKEFLIKVFSNKDFLIVVGIFVIANLVQYLLF